MRGFSRPSSRPTFPCDAGSAAPDLGVSISSRLVQKMGGQLAVQSEVGHGTTMHFALAFELPAPGAITRRPTLVT